MTDEKQVNVKYLATRDYVGFGLKHVGETGKLPEPVAKQFKRQGFVQIQEPKKSGKENTKPKDMVEKSGAKEL